MDVARRFQIIQQQKHLFMQFCLKNKYLPGNKESLQAFYRQPIKSIVQFQASSGNNQIFKEIKNILEENKINIEDTSISGKNWISVKIPFEKIKNLMKYPKISNIYWDLPLYLCNEEAEPSSPSEPKQYQQILPFLEKRKISIALFDTGINKNEQHPNIQVIHKINTTNESSEDLNGHGTYITQLLSRKILFNSNNESSQNSLSISRPQIILHSYKLFDQYGCANLSKLLLLLEVLYEDTVSQKEENQLQFVLIPASTGPVEGYDTLFFPLIEKLVQMNIIIVCAAGNFGPEAKSMGYPAKLLNVLSVGAINSQKQIAFYSSRNNPNNGKKSRIQPIFYDYGKINDKAEFSGSSIAAVQLCAKLSILKALHPDMNIDVIKKLNNLDQQKDQVSVFNLEKSLKKMGWWIELDRSIMRMVLNALGFASLLVGMFFLAFLVII
ncbi:MAG: S8 family serine peptidase [Promethearchaeota archaeon]